MDVLADALGEVLADAEESGAGAEVDGVAVSLGEETSGSGVAESGGVSVAEGSAGGVVVSSASAAKAAGAMATSLPLFLASPTSSS